MSCVAVAAVIAAATVDVVAVSAGIDVMIFVLHPSRRRW